MITLSAIGKNLRASAKAALYILLLTAYIVGICRFEGLHELFHSRDQHVTHTEIEEKDPCHRAIYHHEVEKDGNHDSHVAASDKCDLCDIISHTDQLLLLKFEATHPHYFSLTFGSYSAAISGAELSLALSRAPPFSSLV
jgi:hypothetical protein